MDAQGNTLVVTDTSRQTLAVYKIEGFQVKLIGVRHLDRDFSDEIPKASSPAPLPSKDVPGQDPPSFVRPSDAVRTMSEYEADAGNVEQWNSFYVVPGTIPDVVGRLNKTFKDWKLVRQNAGGGGPARFTVATDKTVVELTVTAVPSAPGWVQVQVTERRSRT